MPSVCVDAFNLLLTKGTGIATYTRSLLGNLKVMGVETHALFGPAGPLPKTPFEAELNLFEPIRKVSRAGRVRRWALKYVPASPVEAHPTPKTGSVIWPPSAAGDSIDQPWAAPDFFRRAPRIHQGQGCLLEMRFEAGAAGPEVMHWTSVLPAFCGNRPNIYTIHDLIPLKLPHVSLGHKREFLALCRQIAARADHIVTVSETARQDILDILGVDERKVTNTYQSVHPMQASDRADPDALAHVLKDQFNLDFKDYFLFFGAIEPKKNVARLLEAYISSGVTRPLVVVGHRGWLDHDEDALFAQIARDGGALASRVRRYEYLPRDMLNSLIQGARASVFPSIYEGFGLPVLESMSLGTAVMTSSNGALAEVAGEGALLVDPYDVAAMAQGFQAMDENDGMIAELEASGLGRSGFFSPERYRARLEGVYRVVN